MAEKEGFEPSIPFWGIHDFQSCALGQLRDFSVCDLLTVSPDIIHQNGKFVKHFFSCFGKFLGGGRLRFGWGAGEIFRGQSGWI